MKYYILYEIINTITNKKYIGVTKTSLNKRWNVHLYRLRKGIATKKLQVAFDIFGEENFCIREITKGTSEMIFSLEKELTKETVDHGYNTIIGGNDVEERRSASLIGHQKMRENPLHRERVIKKISEKNKGLKRSIEARLNQSVRTKGIKKWTLEQKIARSMQFSGDNNPNAGKYRLYLNQQTGIFYNTIEMYNLLGIGKGGLARRFRIKDARVIDFIKV